MTDTNIRQQSSEVVFIYLLRFLIFPFYFVTLHGYLKSEIIMKKKKLKKRIIYQSDTDMIRRTVQEISRIAGRNLLLYRCHCHLTQREVYYQTGINYPLISNYEKEIKTCVSTRS